MGNKFAVSYIGELLDLVGIDSHDVSANITMKQPGVANSALHKARHVTIYTFDINQFMDGIILVAGDIKVTGFATDTRWFFFTLQQLHDATMRIVAVDAI